MSQVTRYGTSTHSTASAKAGKYRCSARPKRYPHWRWQNVWHARPSLQSAGHLQRQATLNTAGQLYPRPPKKENTGLPCPFAVFPGRLQLELQTSKPYPTSPTPANHSRAVCRSPASRSSVRISAISALLGLVTLAHLFVAQRRASLSQPSSFVRCGKSTPPISTWHASIPLLWSLDSSCPLLYTAKALYR